MQTENIASVSEEHSASTEIILGEIEGQNARILELSALINQINTISGGLEELGQVKRV